VGALVACTAVATSAPGGDASTRPTPDGIPITLAAPRPKAAKTVAQQVALTEREKIVLGDLQDHTDKFDETALYTMFAIAARMPKLERIQWHTVDRPAYVSLLADPDRYRATPLTMKVKVFLVRKRQAGVGLSFRPQWDKDRPVWEMDCVQTGVPHEDDKPLKVLSLVDPNSHIGPPDETDEFKRGRYKNGRAIRVAALFYKIFRAKAGTGELRDYPMMVGWQIEGAMSPLRIGGGWGGLAGFLPLLLLILILAGGFYFTRRRLAKLKKSDAAARPRYRPLRYESDEGPQAERDRPDEAEDEEKADGPVDPALASAAEEYLREKEEADGADGKDHHG
jgi:hypothetical protein